MGKPHRIDTRSCGDDGSKRRFDVEKRPCVERETCEVAKERVVEIADEGDEEDENRQFIESQIPDLDKPVKFSSSITGSEQKQLILDISEVSSTLKGNYDYLQGWLQLGILKKNAGDYEGAIEAWNFAGVIRPNVATSFLNLADLYAFYIKDREKAEESFLKAISAEPQNGSPYFYAARFYDDVLGDKDKAKAVLEQGILAGADSTSDLQLLLSSL